MIKFLTEMTPLRNKKKLAVINRNNHEESSRSNQSLDTNVPKIQKDSITQRLDEIEGRVTKKLSPEFSRTESRILGALSKLDEFLLSPQVWVHSGSVPETSRIFNGENQ